MRPVPAARLAAAACAATMAVAIAQVPRTARAAEPGAALLALGLGRCPAVSADEVQRMVGVELRRPVLAVEEPATVSGAPVATTVVRVTCEQLRAAIRIEDLLTGKTVERTIDLAAAAPVARAHLLALSIVELVAASWVELQSNPQPSQPAVGDAAAPEARAAAIEVVASRPGRPVGPRLLIGPVAQTTSAGLWTWGGAVSLGGELARRLAWLVDLTLQHGDETFTLGRVTADTASALAGLLRGGTYGPATLRVGLAVRGGWASLTGNPASASPAIGGAVRGMWWGPALLIGGSIVAHRRLVVELMLEAGRVLLPVVATVQGAAPVAIDGSWIRGGLGVGVAF